MKWWKYLAFLTIVALLLPLAPLAEGDFRIVVDLTPRIATADNPITATARAEGGTTPIQYTFAWHIVEEGEVHYVKEETNTTGVSTLPRPFGASGWVEVSAEDALGKWSNFVQYDFTVTGSTPNPIHCTVHFNQQTVTVGEELIGYTSLTGGTRPFTYAYYWDIKEGDQTHRLAYAESDLDVNRQVIPYGEMVILGVRVRDSVGRSAASFNNAYLDILKAVPNPLTGTVAVDKSTVAPGMPFQVSVQHSGGEPPYRYLYSFDDGEPNNVEDIPGDSASLTHTLNKMGNWSISVTVTDAFNRKLTLTTGIEVAVQPGDTNGDGVVDLTDIVGIIQHILEPARELKYPWAADPNGDGTVDILDLVWVIQRLL